MKVLNISLNSSLNYTKHLINDAPTITYFYLPDIYTHALNAQPPASIKPALLISNDLLPPFHLWTIITTPNRKPLPEPPPEPLACNAKIVDCNANLTASFITAYATAYDAFLATSIIPFNTTALARPNDLYVTILVATLATTHAMLNTPVAISFAPAPTTFPVLTNQHVYTQLPQG